MDNQYFVVTEEEALNRLDKVITDKITTLTRTRIKTLIDDGHITVNQSVQKPSYKVKLNDAISIQFPEVKPLELIPIKMCLDVVYEDGDLLVINKPTGLVVHPTETTKEATLVHGLLYHIKDLQAIDGTLRPGIVHRIDKDTSGLLVVAKNKSTLLALQKALKKHDIKREYIALVEGVIAHNKGKIDAPIGRHDKQRKNMTVTEKGRDSITYFEVLERYPDNTLIHCRLETGRTHQIRVHLQYIQHPIVGDPKYGFRKTSTEYGQYLHAKTLTFVHPTTQQTMTFDAPLPDYFETKIQALKSEH